MGGDTMEGRQGKADELIGGVRLFEAIATHTFGPGETTWRWLVVHDVRRCTKTDILDVAGTTFTGDRGTVTFSLDDFICENYVFTPPVNVVATPWTMDGPAFLTLRHSIVNNGRDVKIEVSTWGPGGEPAAEVVFDWRCRVGAEVFYPPIP
jgi:hypothetical protein